MCRYCADGDNTTIKRIVEVPASPNWQLHIDVDNGELEDKLGGGEVFSA